MTLWPWFVVAGLGALHGLNPATGWLLAAWSGARTQDRAQALRALVPIGAGHLASVGAVAALVALGGSFDRAGLVAGAVLLLVAGIALHAARATLAAAAFLASTLHGAGLMLVPALVPLCVSDTPARELTAAGSLTIAIAAVAVHTAAMLAVTGVLGAMACGPVATVLARVHRLHGRRGARPLR